MKNELRIGNYINNYNKVLSITDDGLLCTGLSIIGVVIIENPKPIPLTEEILLKCGFEWSIQHQAHKHEKFKYVIDFYNSHPQFNSSVCFLNKEHRRGENLICIQYLHQLQNLYFALTNEELTVNL